MKHPQDHPLLAIHQRRARKCIESWKILPTNYKDIEWKRDQPKPLRAANYEAKKYAFVVGLRQQRASAAQHHLSGRGALVRPLDSTAGPWAVAQRRSAPPRPTAALLVNTGSGVGASRETRCRQNAGGSTMPRFRDLQASGSAHLYPASDTPLFTRPVCSRKDETLKNWATSSAAHRCFSPFIM